MIVMVMLYFQRTLEDWAKFDINNRTNMMLLLVLVLALMACNKNRYSTSKIEEKRTQYDLGIKKYDNKGTCF